MTEATLPYEDVALFGRDPAPRLLDVQPLLDGDVDTPARVRLYWRNEDGSLRIEEQPFYPFFLLSDIRLLAGYPRQRFRFQPLQGHEHFRYLVVFESWMAYRAAIRHIEQAASGLEPSPLYLINAPAQQYLMQSGRTCFKGMTLDELHRLQLDIEVYTTAGFPNADRPEDQIVLIALHDNRGWHRVLDVREAGSEAALLRQFLDILRTRDPDVLEGYNLLAFDLPYLQRRCQRYGIPLQLGRDGSEPRTFPASIRFAERTVDYTAFEIAGRHVIDVYFQVLAFDVFKRDLPDYTLKTVARYFGLSVHNRTYITGSELSRSWIEDPDRVRAYVRDDAIETERLARMLSGSAFYLTQMVPMPYGQVARTGPAAKIEALMVREYLRRRHSIPCPQWGSQALGGYTDVFVTGVVGPVVYADVESLYPSIMLTYGIQPRTDRLGLFQQLLRRLTELRLETKRQMREASSEALRRELDARQSSYKILINSFYGMLGFSRATFNDFEAADRVAASGQEVLRRLIHTIQQAGGQVVEVDTDGVLFVPPASIQGEAAERAFVDQLNTALPAGIRVSFEGRFKKMLSYKKKNYALLGYDGSLRFKGSSLISRSVERFGRQFVREAIARLLEEDIQGLHELYLRYRLRILQHAWESVYDFARTETLKDSLENYLADVAAGRRPRAAAYELACRLREAGRPVRKGDRISYYLTGTHPNVAAYEHCRLAEEWDPAHPDENVAYYLRRLDEFARKFEPFFTPADFRRIFSPDDLFGFSSAGIRPIRKIRTPEDVRISTPF
ncbi:MAG: DNA polymerase domain-containing protein [Rhodothermus sp.]|nr:DNA polymerase domain-containing protein [Rhodothermus sp.]